MLGMNGAKAPVRSDRASITSSRATISCGSWLNESTTASARSTVLGFPSSLHVDAIGGADSSVKSPLSDAAPPAEAASDIEAQSAPNRTACNPDELINLCAGKVANVCRSTGGHTLYFTHNGIHRSRRVEPSISLREQPRA